MRAWRRGAPDDVPKLSFDRDFESLLDEDLSPPSR